jgi:hypothetical protein
MLECTFISMNFTVFFHTFSLSCNIIMAVRVIWSRGGNGFLILILRNCHNIDLKSMKIGRTRTWLSEFINGFSDDGSRVSRMYVDIFFPCITGGFSSIVDGDY